MSGRFVRASKYRHIFADPPKPSKLQGKRFAFKGDAQVVAVSADYFAAPIAGGGGPVVVGKINDLGAGKMFDNHLTFNVHHAAVLDTKFSPHRDNVVATAGDDGRISITHLPTLDKFDETKQVSEAAVQFQGHSKKATAIEWNPTASNIVASMSHDHVVKLWDLGNEAEALKFSTEGIPEGIAWNYDGSQVAVVDKGALATHLVDPRAQGSARKLAHSGIKNNVRACWMENHGLILTVGANAGKRKFLLWDLAKADKPIEEVAIDSANGVIWPYYNSQNSILYFPSKGAANVRYFEIGDNKKAFFLSEFRAQTPFKGCCFAPRRSVDVMKKEIDRAVRLGRDDVSLVQFIVPRKSEMFQEDIFPDAPSINPAISGEDWLGGKSSGPKLRSMAPDATEEKVDVPDELTKSAISKLYNDLKDEVNKLSSMDDVAALKKKVADMPKV